MFKIKGSFSYAGCLTNSKESRSWKDNTLINLFPKGIARNKTQTASSEFELRSPEFIFFADSPCVMRSSYFDIRIAT